MPRGWLPVAGVVLVAVGAGAVTSVAAAADSSLLYVDNHPCFEELWPTWREHGAYRTRRYLAEYEIPGTSGVDFHRTISTYLNRLISFGCQITEVAEPGLAPEVAADGPDGIDAYTHLPNFLIVSARRVPPHP